MALPNSSDDPEASLRTLSQVVPVSPISTYGFDIVVPVDGLGALDERDEAEGVGVTSGTSDWVAEGVEGAGGVRVIVWLASLKLTIKLYPLTVFKGRFCSK